MVTPYVGKWASRHRGRDHVPASRIGSPYIARMTPSLAPFTSPDYGVTFTLLGRGPGLGLLLLEQLEAVVERGDDLGLGNNKPR